MLTPAERFRHVALKLHRAREHRVALDDALNTFLGSNPYAISVRRDENSRPVYFVASVQPVPDAICLIAGDALQNLMGALDYLAYQLVCRDTNDAPPNPRWIYFPIADDKISYDAKKRGKMAGASVTTMAAIDGLSPYKGGNDPIWLLYRLNNIEKHRLLLTVGSQAGGIHLGQLMSMHLPSSFPPEAAAMMRQMSHYLMPADNGFPLKAGFELYVGAPEEEINSDLEFRFEVVVNEPDLCEGKPLSDLVLELETGVKNVVDALSPLLA
jgi:hypothetical protein